MKTKFKNLSLALVSAGLLLTGCGPKEEYQKVTGPYLTGELARMEYKGFMGIPLATLNTVTDQTGSNSEHYCNFVEGLLENDEFGALSFAMATKAEKDAENKVFTFTIRDGVKWLKHDGTQYEAKVKGEYVPQFVTADDFLCALQLNLDSANESQTSYIPATFIEGAEEYNYYTEILECMKKNRQDRTGYQWSVNNTADDVANAITALTGKEVFAEELASIKKFERVGIKVSEDNKQIEFTLKESMPFFPTALTYSAFLPVNRAFIKDIGFKQFGINKEKILYNGPYLLETWDENQVVYRKNEEYWDVDKVHLNKMTYKQYPDNSADDFLRKQYEKGDIDGFGINPQDADGWAKYITGKKGNGTRENPAHDDVYSRFVDSIDFNFHFMLNMERDADDWNEKLSAVSQSDVLNWNRAVSINTVRQLFLKAIDLKVYNEQTGDVNDPDDRQTHTFTMKGFVTDDVNNRDYIEYVYEAYAEKYGMSKEEAALILDPGQTNYNGHTNLNLEQVQELAEKAKADIALYNENVGVLNGIEEPITFPIRAELLSTNDAQYFLKEQTWQRDANDRINGCTISEGRVSEDMPLCEGKQYPFFEYVLAGPDQIKSSNDYIKLSDQHQYSMHIMGWAPDYGDPLTYLNCYTSTGEMSEYSGTKNNPRKPAFHSEGGVLKEDIFVNPDTHEEVSGVTGKYDYLVNKAKHEYNDTTVRYRLFAEAEVDLLTDLSLIRSLYNRGQGYFVTVSRVITYEGPTAAYGLSSNKKKGWWVMKNTVGGKKRRELKAQYDQAKADASTKTIFDN